MGEGIGSWATSKVTPFVIFHLNSIICTPSTVHCRRFYCIVCYGFLMSRWVSMSWKNVFFGSIRKIAIVSARKWFNWSSSEWLLALCSSHWWFCWVNWSRKQWGRGLVASPYLNFRNIFRKSIVLRNKRRQLFTMIILHDAKILRQSKNVHCKNMIAICILETCTENIDKELKYWCQFWNSLKVCFHSQA